MVLLCDLSQQPHVPCIFETPFDLVWRGTTRHGGLGLPEMWLCTLWAAPQATAEPFFSNRRLSFLAYPATARHFVSWRAALERTLER